MSGANKKEILLPKLWSGLSKIALMVRSLHVTLRALMKHLTRAFGLPRIPQKKLIAWRRQIAKTLTELFTQLSQGTSTKTKPDFNRSNERFFFVLSCNRRNGRDPSLTFLRLDKPPARQHFLSYAKLKSFCRISCLTRSGALLI